MEVDPSSLFSMLFLEDATFETLGIPDDNMVNLNYTFFGESPLIERKGAWVDITMTIDHDKDPRDIGMDLEVTSYEIDFTIFIAKGKPPDSGLDGTLSICVTP